MKVVYKIFKVLATLLKYLTLPAKMFLVRVKAHKVDTLFKGVVFMYTRKPINLARNLNQAKALGYSEEEWEEYLDTLKEEEESDDSNESNNSNGGDQDV